MSFPKKMAAALLVLGGGTLGSGCVDNDSSLFIYGVMDITRSECVAKPDSGATLLVSGYLDRVFANGYEAAILVGSQLTERGNREKLRTETSRISITGAHVALYGTDGSVIEIDSAATGLANPANGTDPGVAAVFARLVRPEDMANLGPDGQIIARVKILGTTLGGQDIESGEFDYPIQVCTGCLVNYSADSVDPITGQCDQAASTDSSTDHQICFFGQDSSFDCSECASYNTICMDWHNNPYFNGSMP
jgi:hypothetical protein